MGTLGKSILSIMIIGLLWEVLKFINSQIDQFTNNLNHFSSDQFQIPSHNHSYQPKQPIDFQLNSPLPYIYYTNDLRKLNQKIKQKYNERNTSMRSNFKFGRQIIKLKLHQEDYQEEIGMAMTFYIIKETFGKFFTSQEQQNSTVWVKFIIFDMREVIQVKQKLKNQQTTKSLRQYVKQITTSIKHLNFNQTSNTFWLQSILGYAQSQIVRKGQFINLNFIILPQNAAQQTLKTISSQLNKQKGQFQLLNGLHDKNNKNSRMQVSSKKLQTQRPSVQTQKSSAQTRKPSVQTRKPSVQTRKRKQSRKKTLKDKKSKLKNRQKISKRQNNSHS